MILKITRKEKNFAQIDNQALRDSNLSFKARGMLAYLLSMDSEWEVRMENLINQGHEGRCSLQGGFRELKKFGYARVVALWDKATKQLRGNCWEIYEDPADNPDFRSANKGDGQSSRKPVSLESKLIGDQRLRTQRGDKNTNARCADAQPGTCSGFDLVGNDKASQDAQKFAHVFAQWSVKQGFHIGAQGSTKSGWKPTTIKAWVRIAQELIELYGVVEVQRIWKWYVQHHGEEFVSECETMGGFRSKFRKLQSQVKRRNGEQLNGEHAKEPESKGKLVYRETGRGTTIASIER